MSGNNISSQERGPHPINNTAGSNPVVKCEVIQYLNRSFESFFWLFSPSSHLSECLTICTALSA